MNVETMQLDPRIARIHYKDYRKKVREHRTARLAEAEKKILDGGRTIRNGRTERSLIEKEDTILMESYRAMARGQRVLNLASVMRDAKFDSTQKLPVFAIAAADWKECWLYQSNGRIAFSRDRYPRWDYSHDRFHLPTVALAQTIFAPEITNDSWRREQKLPPIDHQRALVPAIPAHLRPAGDLSKYHILWEAEWTRIAPTDPLLLKHVAGTIYSVLAQWDLTPLEKAVLEGRLGT